MKSKVIHGALFGLAVGDALGVPAEFKSRTYLAEHPVNGMEGFGTHNQPAGTWSDDSSLTFCLAESLCSGYNLQDMARKFLQWYRAEIWTAHGEVFDIGIATSKAINEIAKGTDPVLCGGNREADNGNGALMRILPMVFYSRHEADLQTIYERVKEVSAITHAHFRSVFACLIYVVYGLELLKGCDKKVAYQNMQATVKRFVEKNAFEPKEIDLFKRVLDGDISTVAMAEIFSSGYVLHSLEASLWCILTTQSYEDAVLKAVNLGEDSDTTAAIAGGLAGLIYGFDGIPEEWINVLVKRSGIQNLCKELEMKLMKSQKYTVSAIKETDEFFFFWEHHVSNDGMLTKSCLTQWWDAPFLVDQVEYKTAEHWMMSKKAELFNDQITLTKILAANSPEEVKNLGRQVSNYDDAIWSENRYEIVREGNFHKFSQHKVLGDYLINTGKKILAEASPVDFIWGIGLAEENPDAQHVAQWKGLNLLGFALMEVRDQINIESSILPKQIKKFD
ncbi:ADP-ribosylglycohydrolase family protein [Pedobacter sp. GR22-10]|uniref:ADP-ribosylglycohydrolase family protein n=1 Tax=Pedobacter sp. GR22-10 TaxID=2994472 RepID=UPI002245BF2B|nr:ADP-ribosylglycohydrolase family protein [Pedobacter sp. GR22-10]MCX2431057.1 ADP-ribosylglycohydrolase family protein [Pedobacter sp. GR22-10]